MLRTRYSPTITIGLVPLTSASKEKLEELLYWSIIYIPFHVNHPSRPQPIYNNSLMAPTATRIDLTSATITPFEDNATARGAVTTTDDNGVMQFVPTSILQADGSHFSHISIDRLLALLLDTCGNVLPPEGANEDLGFVTALLAAKECGGDAACKELRKRRTIIRQAFEFLVASTTISGVLRSGMRRAKIGEATYLLLPSRL